MFKKAIHRTWLKKINRRTYIIFWLFIILVAVFTACSPGAGKGFLKFMFDGVPEETSKDSVTNAVKAYTDTSINKSTAAVQTDAQGLFYHTPYKDRACSKCHNAEVPGKITYSQDEFCYSCHDDFQKKYSIVHGPVAGGFCTACHAPHFSDNKKLLIRKGQDICLNCHAVELVMQDEAHLDIGKTICTKCHNPHGGDDRYFSN